MRKWMLAVRSWMTRTVRTWLALIAIVAGSLVAARWFSAAAVRDLPRYAYGDRGNSPGAVPAWMVAVQQQLPAALSADVWLIVGWGLVLGGFAWIFRLWAVSQFGRATSGYVLAAVGIVVAAEVTEDGLLYLTLHDRPNPTLLVVATAATATIKWCAVLLAIGGIPATVGIAGRAFMAWCRMHVLKPPSMPRGVKWWNYVLAEPELPSDPTVSEIKEEEGSWVRAYNVPGAQEVIASRKGQRVQGICLSGGGVRSACIAMGAMQEFSKAPPLDPADVNARPGDPGPRLIDTVDYVISVSGGGFSAGARLLAVKPPEGSNDSPPRLSQRFEEGSPEFDHFRRGSSYIADSPAALIRALAEVLKNLLASMLILFTIPVMLGWGTGLLLAYPYFSFAAFVPVPKANFDTEIKPKHPDYLMALIDHPASWCAVVFFAIVAVVLTMLAIVAEWIWYGPRSGRWRMRLLRAARGSAVFAVLVLTVIAGLPWLMRLCSKVSDHAASHAGTTAATITGVVGLNYLTAIVAMAWKKRSTLPIGEVTKPSWWKRVLPPAVLQLSLVLLTLAVLLVVWLITLGSFAAGIFRHVTSDEYGAKIHNVPYWPLWLAGLALTALCIGLMDVTSLSLHPFYRLRLMRTFAVRRVQISAAAKDWRAERYPETEWTWLNGDTDKDKYGRAPGGRPRFVFTAAAALSGDAKPAPGLNAVSYVLSADHIGGPELGWFKTKELFEVAPPRIKGDLTVLASIAVSGAAFASAMGRQDKGFQKLLAVSGARLGTWLPNPRFAAKLACAGNGNCVDHRDNDKPWPKSLPTIRGAGYFYRELFGINSGDARLVQVTDGGHYENLGLVEALRRRCRLIFCIDGGGDTPPLLSSLGDAMRLAEYELGVTITFNKNDDYAVDNVAPGSGRQFGEGHALASLNSRLTKGTVVAGLITYPPAAGLPNPTGVLIFAKAVLWEGSPQWLLTYAASSNVFPHDSTTDQWFNEGQFAAYTELGRIMGREALKCATAFAGDKLP